MVPPISRSVLLPAALLAACAPPPAPAPAPASPTALEAAAHAPLRVRVEERFYAVEGTSAWSINADLAGRGPTLRGRRWHALTDFSLRWRYLPRVRGDRCVADDVVLEVDIVTTLPRWRDRELAAPHLASDWDAYLTRLRAHEAGHQNIVLAEGLELLDSVEELAAPDCRALRHLTRRLLRQVREEVDARHATWDRASAYGTGGS